MEDNFIEDNYGRQNDGNFYGGLFMEDKMMANYGREM